MLESRMDRRENGGLSTMDSIESRSVFQDEDKSEIEDEEDDEDLPPRIGMDSDDKDNSEQRFIRQALRSIPSMSKHLRSPEHNRTTLRYVHSYKSYLWNHAASMRVQKNGHFLLTNLLLETMKNTARVSHKEGRIVNVSSEGHRFAYSEGVRFDKINDESSFNTIYAYGQSKLANILHANELARRLKEEGVKITANSLHPGAIATNLLRHHGFLDGQDSRID